MDDDRSHTISFEEFKKGCHDFGLRQLADEEVREMFNAFNVDRGGQLDFNEFIAKLRPPLRESRVAVIKEAFEKADKSGDGILIVADLKGIYYA